MADRQKYNDRVVQSLRSAVTDGRMGLDDVPALVKRVIGERMWRARVIEQTGEFARFERFADFIRAKPPEGLGCEVKTLERLCADDKTALDALDRVVQNRRGGRKPNSDNVRLDACLHGNSRQYALRRLRTSRPDLHAEVLAGRLSPHKAMRQAGFRRETMIVPLEPSAAARAIVTRFDKTRLEAFLTALGELTTLNNK